MKKQPLWLRLEAATHAFIRSHGRSSRIRLRLRKRMQGLVRQIRDQENE